MPPASRVVFLHISANVHPRSETRFLVPAGGSVVESGLCSSAAWTVPSFLKAMAVQGLDQHQHQPQPVFPLPSDARLAASDEPGL